MLGPLAGGNVTRSILALSAVIMAMMTASVVFSAYPDDTAEVQPCWAFIRVQDRSMVPEVSSALQAEGIELGSTFRYVPFVQAMLRSPDDVRTALSIPGVISVMEQRAISLAMNISVRAMKAEPSELYSPGTARDLGYTGKGITIAIIDGGVDNEHPTFQGAFVAGADFSSPPTPLNPRDGSVDPDDLDGHGTSVASVALGRGDGNGNFKGMAPEAGLIDLRIRKAALTLPGPMTDAIEWCIANKDKDWGGGYTGVDVISISAGLGQAGGPVDLAVASAVSQGMVVVSAATNSGTSYEDNPNNRNDYWADDSIIAGGTQTMGTIDRSDDVFWDQSTWGPRTPDADDDFYDELKPDVSAPGADLVLAAHSINSGTTPASGYVIGSGTSFSTPHVSGLVAMMLEANPTIVPDQDVNPVRLILHKSSESRGEVYDQDLSLKYDMHYGYGIIDSYEALNGAKDFTRYESGPTILSFTSEGAKVAPGGTMGLSALAVDDQEQRLTYEVTCVEGTVAHGDAPRTWLWTAPAEAGNSIISLTVTDPAGLESSAEVEIAVVEGETNSPPVIESIDVSRTIVKTGGETDIYVKASDPDGDDLTFDYLASAGQIVGDGNSVTFEAPRTPGIVTIDVVVRDTFGAKDQGQVMITVQEEVFGDPPTIMSIDFDPPAFKSGFSGSVAIRTTVVKETYEILYVRADLSALGLGEVQLFDDGTDPDDRASDREYSAYLGDLSSVREGRYTIQVRAVDEAGFTSTSSEDIVIDKGSGGGDDFTLLSGAASVAAISLLALLVVGVIVFALVRLTKRT